MISTAEFRNGAKVELDKEPFIIVEFQHVKPGKGGAFVRTKLKNLKTGAVIDRTYRSGEKLDTPNLEERVMQYLYSDGSDYHFMDTSSFEQLSLTEEQFTDAKSWVKENTDVTVLYYNGVAINVQPPMFVELKVTQTDPGVRGDTASGGSKPATLETGAVVKVPLYLNEGEIIKVDTRTGDYIERVKQ